MIEERQLQAKHGNLILRKDRATDELKLFIDDKGMLLEREACEWLTSHIKQLQPTKKEFINA